jgi:hypothetical protein
MPKRLTQEEFISRSIEAHGKKYNYSLVKYVNISTKVDIICKKHGLFKQTPNHHMNGSGCWECSYQERGYKRLKGKEYYINKLKAKYGENYKFVFDYPFKDSIKVFCKEHGWIDKHIGNLLNGEGCPCPFCSGKRTKKEEFLIKVNKKYNNKYNYSYIDFNNKKNFKIICPIHGGFYQTYNEHLHMKGDACPLCHTPLIHSNEVFLDLCRKKYGDLYDLSLVDYCRSNKNIKIICKKHGIFEKTPNKFLAGQGCQKCSRSMSLGEQAVEKALISFNQYYKRQYWFEDLKCKSYLKFDFAVFKNNSLLFLIEYDGEQHFGIFEFHKGDFEKIKKRDKIKTDYCLKNNIKLVRIPYWDKDNIETILENVLTNS